MKIILSLALLLLIVSCKEKKYEHSMIVYDGYTMVPMEDFYRKVTGYDSIQLLIRHGKLEANFCYPNEWEFEKWKRLRPEWHYDSVGKVIYIYDTMRVFNPDSIEVGTLNSIDTFIIGGN